MKDDNAKRLRANRVWLTADSCDLEEFKGAASSARSTAPIIPSPATSCRTSSSTMASRRAKPPLRPRSRKELLAEWAEALMDGPGIIVLRHAFPDHAPIDAATAVFQEIIAEQHATNTGGGDHFAKPGANDRIWNALEKLCLRAPEVFAGYYGNDILAMVSEAWLGPAYQFTSQVNVVNPGGAAQSAHRDYHLGFMTTAQLWRNTRPMCTGCRRC